MRNLLIATLIGTAVAGCSCSPPAASDADTSSLDASMALDAVADRIDVGTDARVDAWAEDAWVSPELVLRTIDPSPCPPVAALPRRPRGLPVDATPRVLWRRTFGELGIEGYPLSAGALGRDGHVHLSTVSFGHQHFEIDGDGALLGGGLPGGRGKGPTGPMAALFDGRVAEWSQSRIRLDHTPPEPDSGGMLEFRADGPRDFDWVDVSATSDGFYAYRSSRGLLRKYCADGRLQWELLGINGNAYFQVEDDDSIWFNAGPATDFRMVRVDRNGAVVERLPWPSGVSHEGMSVLFADTTRFVNTLSVDGRTSFVVAIEGVSGRELYRIEHPVEELQAFRPDPFGGVWIGLSSVAGVRYVDGVEVARASPNESLQDAIITADGSMLTAGSSIESPSVVRLLPDGSIGWELPVPLFPENMILDVDGRLYFFETEVVAVQTDVLPPGIRGCWQHRCSPGGDNRIEPLP